MAGGVASPMPQQGRLLGDIHWEMKTAKKLPGISRKISHPCATFMYSELCNMYHVCINGCQPKNNGKTPQIIHFNKVFHYFHHPFWGTPIFGDIQMYYVLCIMCLIVTQVTISSLRKYMYLKVH